MASSLSTDSNANVSYGPFVSARYANELIIRMEYSVTNIFPQYSTHVKTGNKSTSHRMEVTATGMKISFRAPQIIGWVSEILPELPRRANAGGLRPIPVRYS